MKRRNALHALAALPVAASLPAFAQAAYDNNANTIPHTVFH